MSRVLSDRQQAYLGAMDIELWHLRESPVAEVPATYLAPALKLGPGGGGVLLVCAADTDSASRLANDISRSLGAVPVWSWPDANSSAVTAATAVEENLFTTVAFFGEDLAAQFFTGDIPASLKSAKVVVLPAMQDIQNRADSRRALWATFCRSGMVNTRDQQT